MFRLHLQRLLHSVRQCSPYGAGPCGHRWLLCRTWRMSGCSCIRSGRCLCSKANSMYAAESSLSEARMVSFVYGAPLCADRRWAVSEPIYAEGRKKTRVVVLGSGWAAATFVKNLDSKLTGEPPIPLNTAFRLCMTHI